MTDQLDITYVPLDQLEEWPSNARVGDVERIKNSMKTHGVFNPLVVQRSTGRVMIGNHRLKALRQLHDEDPSKWDGTAPVAYYDVDNTQATKINLIDNKLSDDATMDDELLRAQLEAIKEEDGDLAGTGYLEDELVDLIHSIESEDYDEDRAEQYEEGHTASVTRRNIELDLIFSSSGEVTRGLGSIAYAMGWNPGVITTSASSARRYVQMFPKGKPIMFMDNEWHGYDHEEHLAVLREFHPKYATVRDLVTKAQAKTFNVKHYSIAETVKMAEEVAQHCERVILIPKYDCLDDLPREIGGKQVVLGYSVESSYGGTEIPPERFKGWPVHLLGGSWKRQRALLNILKEDVVSLDNNNLLNIARFGSINLPGGSTKTLEEHTGYIMHHNNMTVSAIMSLALIAHEVTTLYGVDLEATADAELETKEESREH